MDCVEKVELLSIFLFSSGLFLGLVWGKALDSIATLVMAIRYKPQNFYINRILRRVYEKTGVSAEVVDQAISETRQEQKERFGE